MKEYIIGFIVLVLVAGIGGFLLHEYIWAGLGLIGFVAFAIGVWSLFGGDYELLLIGLAIQAAAFLAALLCYNLWDLFPNWVPLLH